MVINPGLALIVLRTTRPRAGRNKRLPKIGATKVFLVGPSFGGFLRRPAQPTASGSQTMPRTSNACLKPTGRFQVHCLREGELRYMLRFIDSFILVFKP